jgi:hypothetical protein
MGYLSIEASFITKNEYAKMLYDNPRGIGCNKCHGERGEGMVMSIYIKDGKEKEIRAPRINNISMKKFYQAFKKKSNLMPSYFLTNQEKAYIYYYLTSKSDKKDKQDANSKEY